MSETTPGTAGASSPAPTSPSPHPQVPLVVAPGPLEQAREFLEQPRVTTTDTLPVVTIPGGAVTITESATELFRAIAPHRELFYRGGVVVELVTEEGGSTTQVLDAAAAQSRFEKYVRFVKPVRAPEQMLPSRTNISETIARQYLRSEACRTLLPKLNGILQCALLVERNGQLHRVTEGYDEATGFLITGGQPPMALSLEDAVLFLTSLVQDFDFVTPGDRSRAIASLITPALKLGGLIQGPIPVDVAEANASQSGKTYRQKIVAALYNQRLAVVTKKSGGVGSMEETFNDHLVKARTFVQFDNVRGKLDSQFLESFLTASGPVSARIPHHGSVAIDASKFILFISSNGFEATKDLANRASIIRIRKREGFQYRLFEGKDMLQLTYLWQPMFMGALFAVIEEWFRQGKPKTGENRHDFREWVQSLDWILQNIFHEAPLMDGHDVAKERAASPQLSFMRNIAVRLGDRGRLGTWMSASDLADFCLEEDVEMPGLPPDNQTVEEGRKQIGRIMSKLLGDSAELLFDQFRLLREQERAPNSAGNAQTLNRYLITNATAPNP